MKITVNNKQYELEDLHITGNSAEESEFNINLLSTDDYVKYYASGDKYFTKIKKNIVANPKDWKLTKLFFRSDGTLSGIEAHGPINGLSLRAGGDRQMSEEGKRALAERLAAGRNKQK